MASRSQRPVIPLVPKEANLQLPPLDEDYLQYMMRIVRFRNVAMGQRRQEVSTPLITFAYKSGGQGPAFHDEREVCTYIFHMLNTPDWKKMVLLSPDYASDESSKSCTADHASSTSSTDIETDGEDQCSRDMSNHQPNVSKRQKPTAAISTVFLPHTKTTITSDARITNAIPTNAQRPRTRSMASKSHVILTRPQQDCDIDASSTSSNANRSDDDNVSLLGRRKKQITKTR